MPKVGSRAKTPDGEGVVESNDILKQQVKVKIMDKDGSFDVKTYDLKDVSARVHQSVEPDDSSDDEELKNLKIDINIYFWNIDKIFCVEHEIFLLTIFFYKFILRAMKSEKSKNF